MHTIATIIIITWPALLLAAILGWLAWLHDWRDARRRSARADREIAAATATAATLHTRTRELRDEEAAHRATYARLVQVQGDYQALVARYNASQAEWAAQVVPPAEQARAA